MRDNAERENQESWRELSSDNASLDSLLRKRRGRVGRKNLTLLCCLREFWLGYHSHASYKLHPGMCDSSRCFITSPTFGIVSLLKFQLYSYTDILYCVQQNLIIVLICVFLISNNLYYFIWILIGHFAILFCEKPDQMFCPFLGLHCFFFSFDLYKIFIHSE